MQQYTRVLISLYELELNINENIHKQFEFAEPLLRNLNKYLDPTLLLNVWIPLVAGYNQKLLIQLVSTLGLVNTLASVIKWCLPEYRPIWWVKEQNNHYDRDDIKFDSHSCDTSGGFPSTHILTFTSFTYIVVSRFVKLFSAKIDFFSYDSHLLTHAIALVLSTLLWLSRLYFFHEFLHQCIIGSLLAIVLLSILKHFSIALLHLSKLKAFFMIISLAAVPISTYFLMLFIDMDPFWSVRMAFKWCGDPLYLKHESTPLFILCRDFGYLLGVALSCPLAKSYANTANNYRKRLSVLIIIEILNFVSYSYTPKQYGRFIFVAYEFSRNCIHTFSLLTMLPKLIDTK